MKSLISFKYQSDITRYFKFVDLAVKNRGHVKRSSNYNIS